LLPALAATGASAQVQSAALTGTVYHNDKVPFTGNETKTGRRFFMGKTHGGFNLEMHETTLAPGIETHPPHKHLHEEILIVVEGTVQTYIDGKTDTAQAGSVIFYGSNQMHNAKNVGTVTCKYKVIELRGNE
jgi:quercetin dioxygenase-like cupin family protein